MVTWKKALVAVLVAAGFAAGVAVGAQAPTPKKGYMVARVKVLDPQKYGEYGKVSPGIVAQYGGRYLARGGRTVTLEGPEVTDRVVIVEFPSFEQAERFYRSPEYTDARKIRAGATEASFVLLEEYRP